MRRSRAASLLVTLLACAACKGNVRESARGPSGGSGGASTDSASAGTGGASSGGGTSGTGVRSSGGQSTGGKSGSVSDGGADARGDPKPEVLFPLNGGNLGHVYVDDRLLWYVQGDMVFQASKDGTGTPQSIGTAAGGASNRFLDDATSIYWLDDDRLQRVPKAGGAKEEWLFGTGTSFAYGGFVFSDDYVYLLDATASGIWRMPKGGGAVETFAQGMNTQGDKGGGVRFNLVDRTLYASYLVGVWSISLDTRAVTKISPAAIVNPSVVVALAGSLYFVDGRYDTGGTLYGFSSGTTPASVQTEPQSTNVGFIEPDERRSKLYWIASVPGPIIEFDAKTKTMATLTTKQQSSGLPAADDDYLYWARNSVNSPAIMRLMKR